MTSQLADPRLVFLDTEATSLRPDRRAWDIALIVRRPGHFDHEQSWFVRREDLELGNADLTSLRIGGFHARHPQAIGGRITGQWPVRAGRVHPEFEVLAQIEDLTRDAILVGAVPDFDAYLLAERMRAHGLCPAWHYHLVDVETLAAGALRQGPPWGFDTLLARYGLVYDEAERHTALGDARMVRDLYDAVLGIERPGQPPTAAATREVACA